MITISSGAVTHRGLVRETNEDSMLVTDRLVAVADGLGGHAGGEVASKIAVDCLGRLADQPIADPDDIVGAIIESNRVIIGEARRHPEYLGMGTTLCGVGVVAVDGFEQCVVFNVGDSRVYRYAGGALAQMTVDHSEVEELRAAGQISARDMARHPRRNVVTRCLGTDPSPQPDVWVLPPAGTERFLVCSDGLTGEVDDAAITDVLRAHPEPRSAAAALLEQALAGGGRDNITVIVVELGDSATRTPSSRAD